LVSANNRSILFLLSGFVLFERLAGGRGDEMKPSFCANLPPDALASKFTIPFRIGANAAFGAIGHVIFLANRDSLPVWMSGTIHIMNFDDGVEKGIPGVASGFILLSIPSIIV
jgi:hypothetical protein